MVERILYVCASPRGERSVSAQITDAFLAALAERKAVEIDHLNPWECDLPEVDGALLAAKYAGLGDAPLSTAQAAAWDRIKTLAQRFHRADTLVFSVPMWNFGIPYKLKHLIDAISHKDVLFTFDEHGLNGMLGGRRAVAIYTRGLGYGPTSQTPDQFFGLEKTFIDTWFRFVGINQAHSVVVEQTLGPEGARIRESAIEQVTLLAQNIDQKAAQTLIVGRDG
ncbi:NAD(P)H-dependent oxidoreductase [Pseudomonas plecoglossicida]|uniref:FMN-dependent NADH-azoreductase n=1 Tax=Pseudomonas TaxID=286 RepID=UPI0009E8A10C|nr:MULTISPECIES: NAD(P)H-dependent oxidoreductase [Pseudomonas]MDQ7967337.1 NAD(P)H-dependent oxidoreductase [Pseudomonas plecoglossicida]WBM46406.1 NAD(P)H-dependent oxidoreductase [Pseudomonas putida]WFG02764.1 NAD(P)H-dependent oxidoreductase [Pseudomonas putida]